MKLNRPSILFLLMVMTSCLSKESVSSVVDIEIDNVAHDIVVAHLDGWDRTNFIIIQKAFAQANPGYALNYFPDKKSIDPCESNRIIFIQSGGGTVTLNSGPSSKFSIGDIIMLDAGESVSTDSAFSSLHFEVPSPSSSDIPPIIRPDWDENITDIPGGCATETNAYRRILLTWKKEVGAYVNHELNAHRVRIMDSFSHYHPKEGGFDEFYLVQMAQTNARIITSAQVDVITNPNQINKKQASELLDETALKVGDLVYLPRGVMHRGLGGVLAQVITVPGFIPGAEIGVDHHLKRINDRLELEGENMLPYNEEASDAPIIK